MAGSSADQSLRKVAAWPPLQGDLRVAFFMSPLECGGELRLAAHLTSDC